MKDVQLRIRTVYAEGGILGRDSAIVSLEPDERILSVEGGHVGGHASFVVVTAEDLTDDGDLA